MQKGEEFDCGQFKLAEIFYSKAFDASAVEMKGSSQGKYISLTCNVFVKSKDQLDKIYIDLSKHPLTKFVL